MAVIKKNQLANIIFPMVDKVDFASIESGITASNFNSAAVKKFYGVTHGNSTAFTSGTISKATSLVRSGIFQQTLKASETNYDYLLVRFTHPSCADQLLVFHPVDYDDSDLMSRLSDIGSDLLSYLTGMSGMLSDVYSNLSDFKSDFQSRVPKEVANNSQLSDLHSDLRSYLIGISGLLSDVESQIDLIPLSISASDMSDIVSRVWSAKYTAHSVASSFGSLVSDIFSRLVLTQSNVSDVQSALDSQFLILLSNLSDIESQVDLLATSNYLSQVHSDLGSKIGGITATLTASDISDIASAVWAAKYTGHSAASSFGSLVSDIFSRVVLTQSLVSDVDSQLLLNASMISDAYSLLSDLQSDFQSRVPKRVATDSQLSDVHSDLLSYLAGLSGLISDVDSQVLINASLISDIYSLLSDHHSDFQSRVSSNLTSLLTRVSQIDSGVDRLQQAQIAKVGTFSSTVVDPSTVEVDGIDHDSEFNGQFIRILDGSQINELRLIVDTDKTNSHLVVQPPFNSRVLSGVNFVITGGNPYQSQLYELVSDVDSQLDLNASMISNTYSLLSDHHSEFQSRVAKAVATNSQLSDLHSDLRSYLVGLSTLLSDVESQVDLLTTSNYLSQVHSDISSKIAGITATVTASDMSDIASRVWATAEGQRVDSRILVIQSLVSDVDSQLLLNASVISDIYSLLSDHHSDFQSRVNKQVASSSQLSDLVSDLRSYLIGLSGMVSDVESQLDLNASVVSDIQSALDSQYAANSNYLSQIHSDLGSKVGGVTATLTASDISDIGSAVWANSIGARVDSRIALIQSNVSDVESQLDLTASLTSDIYSLLSDFNSNFQSRVDKRVANYSQLSDIDSNLLSYLTGLSNLLSDVESQIDLLATSNYLSQVHSDLGSKIANVSVVLTASNISDIASAVSLEVGSSISDIYSLLQTFPVFSTATERTYTVVESDGTPIQGVHVDISTDLAGSNVVWSGDTDTFGITRDDFGNKPRLEAGTYYFWRSKVGFSFDNPDTEILA